MYAYKDGTVSSHTYNVWNFNNMQFLLVVKKVLKICCGWSAGGTIIITGHVTLPAIYCHFTITDYWFGTSRNEFAIIDDMIFHPSLTQFCGADKIATFNLELITIVHSICMRFWECKNVCHLMGISLDTVTFSFPQLQHWKQLLLDISDSEATQHRYQIQMALAPLSNSNGTGSAVQACRSVAANKLNLKWIGKISLPLSSDFLLRPKQTAKKLQNLKNEFVKLYIVLQERIKHMNVKFELLWQNRGSCWMPELTSDALQCRLTQFLPGQNEKRLRKNQNELVKFYTLLEQTIAHITVQFGVLWLDREPAVSENVAIC